MALLNILREWFRRDGGVAFSFQCLPSVLMPGGRRLPQQTKKLGKSKKVTDSPAMSVVGFGSQAGVWAEFDDRWSKVLSHYDVPFFHAGDFAWSRWPFNDGWKGEEQKRRDFQSELINVIQTCGLRKFGSVLWVSDQHKARAKEGLETDSTATPYVMCSGPSLCAGSARNGKLAFPVSEYSAIFDGPVSSIGAMLKLAGGEPRGRLRLQLVSERNHVRWSPIHTGRARAKRNSLGKKND